MPIVMHNYGLWRRALTAAAIDVAIVLGGTAVWETWQRVRDRRVSRHA